MCVNRKTSKSRLLQLLLLGAVLSLIWGRILTQLLEMWHLVILAPSLKLFRAVLIEQSCWIITILFDIF